MFQTTNQNHIVAHHGWYLPWSSTSLWLSQQRKTPAGTCSREHLPASAPKAWGSSMVQMHKGPRWWTSQEGQEMGVTPNWWFIREHPANMDDLGVPLFQETPKLVFQGYFADLHGYGYHWSGHCSPLKTIKRAAFESPNTDWVNSNYP